MELIKRAWRGEERLWKVFWLYGALLGSALAVIAGIVTHFLGAPGTLLFAVIQIVYFVWLLVAEWRCAFNADWKFWSYVVRVLVVVYILAIPATLIGGVLFGQGLIKTAECRKEAVGYIANGGKDIEGFMKNCRLRKVDTNNDSGNSKKITIAPPSGSEPPVSDIPRKDKLPPTKMDYSSQCLKNMAEFAEKNHVNPQEYIADNQSYFQQCVQYYNFKALDRSPLSNPANQKTP